MINFWNSSTVREFHYLPQLSTRFISHSLPHSVFRRSLAANHGFVVSSTDLVNNGTSTKYNGSICNILQSHPINGRGPKLPDASKYVSILSLRELYTSKALGFVSNAYLLVVLCGDKL
jgi:hypothetical protein